MKTSNRTTCPYQCHVLLALLLAVPTLVSAGGPGKQERYWGKYAQAKQALMQAWTSDADDKAYADAIFEVGKYHTYLLAAHVRPDDKRLLGQAAAGKGFRLQSRYDSPIFAYRVFKHELGYVTGFEPDPARLFHNRTFTIYRKITSEK